MAQDAESISPTTRAAANAGGRRDFEEHLEFLKVLLAGVWKTFSHRDMLGVTPSLVKAVHPATFIR